MRTRFSSLSMRSSGLYDIETHYCLGYTLLCDAVGPPTSPENAQRRLPQHDQPRTKVSHARLFPLAMAAEGDKVRICFLRAGKGLEKRLIEMGLNLETELEVVQRHTNGAVVIARGEMRLALGAGMAHKIMVAPVGL